MSARRHQVRRVGRGLARTGVAVSAAMLALSLWAAVTTSAGPAGAAATGAAAEVVTPGAVGVAGGNELLVTGGSATPFTLRLPQDAACSGDSANDGYRVQSYMVPTSVDPLTLQFGANGPGTPGVGTAFRQPLYTTESSPYVQKQTAAKIPPAATGQIVNIPAFDFRVFADAGVANPVPAGTYNVGIACTLGTPSATQLDRLWNVQLVIVADASDVPTKLKWVVSATQSSTTTSTAATTTTTGVTTTTSSGAASTTTTAPSTTTTGDPSATTTTMVSAGAAANGDPPVYSAAAEQSQLPRTGANAMPLVVWSALLLVFGRVAVLLSRPVEIR